MEKLLPDTNSSETNPAVPVLDKLIQFSLCTFAVFSMFSISVTQISFAIGAFAWLIKTHLTKSWKELRGTLAGIAILCFCLASILSLITAVDLEHSIKFLKKLLQFVIFFWVANAVQGAKQRDLLIILLIVAGVVAALNGLLPLLDPGSFSPERLYGESRRLLGTTSVAAFSAAMMLVSLATLGRFLFHKTKEYWVLGSVGIIGLALLFAQTRQAWLGFFTGTLFLVFCWNKKYLLVLPLLLASLLFFAPDRIVDRMSSFTDLQDHSFRARVSLWKGGWEIFKDYPITGCGYNCVDLVHSQYPDPSGWIARLRGMHSNIIQLLVDTGIVGLGTWLSIWVAYFVEVFKRWRALAGENFQDNAAGILMGSSAAVLSFLIGGFFETNIYDSEVAMLLYFLMGLSLAKVEKVTRAD